MEYYERFCENNTSPWRHGDWLFKPPTLRCGCGTWDNDPYTRTSHLVLPLMYAVGLATSVAACLPSLEGEDSDLTDDPSSDEEDRLSPAKPPPLKATQRMWHLDYARIACVAAVVTEHSGGDNYAANNVLWVQQWVLPYLYAISGVSFMISSAPLWVYEVRLLIVFVSGVATNWLADIISRRDWQGDFGNTIFQMAYVIMLMSMSFCTEPLRKALLWRRGNPGSAKVPRELKLWAALYIFLTAVGFVWFLSGDRPIDVDNIEWLGEMKGAGFRVLNVIPLLLAQMGGQMTICFVCCLTGPAHGSSGWVTWILLVVVLLQQVAIPYKRGGHPFDADLFVWGMVAWAWPLKGQELVARVIREYWPMLIMALLLLSMPHVEGRCDLDPLNTWWERLRFRAVEAALLVALLSGALNTGDSLGVTRWLNVWALFAYCSHVAWARLFGVPYGAVVSYASAAFFYAMDVYRKRKLLEAKLSEKPGEQAPGEELLGNDSPAED